MQTKRQATTDPQTKPRFNLSSSGYPGCPGKEAVKWVPVCCGSQCRLYYCAAKKTVLWMSTTGQRWTLAYCLHQTSCKSSRGVFWWLHTRNRLVDKFLVYHVSTIFIWFLMLRVDCRCRKGKYRIIKIQRSCVFQSTDAEIYSYCIPVLFCHLALRWRLLCGVLRAKLFLLLSCTVNPL